MKMISNGFQCILDGTANMRACCLGNHLGMSPLVHNRTFVKIYENYEEDVACVSCSIAQMLMGVLQCMHASVVLPHSSFDISYTY